MKDTEKAGTAVDAWSRLYLHFCRHPSFRRALLESDPEAYGRLERVSLGRLDKEE